LIRIGDGAEGTDRRDEISSNLPIGKAGIGNIAGSGPPVEIV